MKKWNELEFSEKIALVRSYTAEALKDDDCLIRLDAY